MFDLIAGQEKHLPSHATVPILVSTSAQAMVIAMVAMIPLMFATERLPKAPVMMAFVAAPSTPPPPPPPPPAPASAKPKPAPETPAASETRFIAPLEEPARISELPDDEGLTIGVPGGVEGGIIGGVVGGVGGGVPEAAPPPPPPAPPPPAPGRLG